MKYLQSIRIQQSQTAHFRAQYLIYIPSYITRVESSTLAKQSIAQGQEDLINLTQNKLSIAFLSN